VGPGWRCLEVGAGSGSVARWLGERVAPGGHVVAADIDTRFVETPPAGLAGILEVRRCDIRSVEFPVGAFDLIHTRFVLEHLSDRVDVMRRMMGWLRPGGWVCFEEPDCYAGCASPNRPWARHMEAYRADPGYDVSCGRALPGEMRSVGMVDLHLDIEVAVVAGGEGLARWHAMTIQALRPALAGTGAVTGEELDHLCAALEQPHFLEPGFTVVAATARRPTSSAG
jgi:SAM-dependent methyltransferase